MNLFRSITFWKHDAQRELIAPVIAWVLAVMSVCNTEVAATQAGKVEVRPFGSAASILVPSSVADRSWMDWPDLDDRDSLAGDLFAAAEKLRSASADIDAALTEALCWHLLYRMGIDSGRVVSDRILLSMEQSGHRLPEISWLHGMNCIWSGRICRGISILDSIRIATCGRDRTFSYDFFKFIRHCFIPVETEREAGDIVIGPPSALVVRISPEETVAQRQSLALHVCGGGERFSVFDLSAEFELTPWPSLQFLFPQTASENGMRLAFKSPFTEMLPKPPVADPFALKTPMELRIMAMPGSVTVPLMDYVASFIDERFYQVWTCRDLERFGAVSVRCREQSVFRGVPGKYYAFVAFDARLSSGGACIRLDPVEGRPAGREELMVRYLLVVRTRHPVEAKAEELLQNILLAFNSGRTW